MKTKLIFLTAALSAIVLSCKTDRDEDLPKNEIESVKKMSNQKLNFNKSELKKEDATTPYAIPDTIRGPQNALPEDPITPPNGETIDPTKPDKPW